MELVRISTAGSVDDGKSTLIGRLLYDNNALTKEQEELVEKKTKEKGLNDLDFSVITDGLIAEREQGITIDVAHIYFSTASKKFIIADSPGHIEYTRNMVTGASTAELSIILIDVRKGLLEQSYRHFFISHLLRLEKVIFCINKMDLVDYSEDKFIELAIEIKKMVDSLSNSINYEILPVSSLKGDNIVHPSSKMEWYKGQTLNQLLHKQTENLEPTLPFRLDVQQVYHVQNDAFTDFRGYAGRVLSGKVQLGDKITVLPSMKETVVTEIRRFEESLETAESGDSIILSVSDNIDISRGAIITGIENVPTTSEVMDATLVWMDETAVKAGDKFVLKSGSRELPVRIQELNYVIDPVQPTQHQKVAALQLNDIAVITLRLSQPAFLDSYTENKKNGVFVLINARTNATAAVGFKN